MCILKSNAYHYFAEYRGGLDGYVGKSIPVASIRSCVGVLLVRIILYTSEQEGLCDFYFVYVWNSMRLRDRLVGREYLYHVSCYL